MHANRNNTIGSDPPAKNNIFSTSSDHTNSLDNDSSHHTGASDADSKSVQSTSTSGSFYELWKNEIESLKSRLDRQLQNMVAKSQHEIDLLSAAVSGQLQIQPSNEYEITSSTDVDRFVRNRSSQVGRRSRSSSLDSLTSQHRTPLSKLPSMLSLDSLRKQSVLSSVASAWTGNSIDDRPNSPRSMMRLRNQQNRWIKQRRMANHQQIEAAPKVNPVEVLIKRKPKPAPSLSLKPAASNMSIGNRSERTEPKSNLSRHVTARRIHRVLVPSQSNGSVATSKVPFAPGAQTRNDTKENHIRSKSSSDSTSFRMFSRALSPTPLPHSGSPINYPAPIDEEEDGIVTTDDEGIALKKPNSFSTLRNSMSIASKESVEVHQDAFNNQSSATIFPNHTTTMLPRLQSNVIVVDQEYDIDTSSAEMVLLSPLNTSHRRHTHSEQESIELSRSSTPESCMDPIMTMREETDREISILSGSGRANQQNSHSDDRFNSRNHYDTYARIQKFHDQEILHIDEESNVQDEHEWMEAELNNRRDQAQYDARLEMETTGGAHTSLDEYRIFDPVVERRRKSATPVTREFLSIFTRMDELRSNSAPRTRGADAPALSQTSSLKQSIYRPDAPGGEEISANGTDNGITIKNSFNKIERSESRNFREKEIDSFRQNKVRSSRSFDDLILLSQYLSSNERRTNDGDQRLELVNSDLIDEILEGDDVDGLYIRLIESLNMPDDADPSKKANPVFLSRRNYDENSASRRHQSSEDKNRAIARSNVQYIDLTNQTDGIRAIDQRSNSDKFDEFRFIKGADVKNTRSNDKYAVSKNDIEPERLAIIFEGKNEARQDSSYQKNREYINPLDDVRQKPEPQGFSQESAMNVAKPELTVNNDRSTKRDKSLERPSTEQKKLTNKTKQAKGSDNVDKESRTEQVINQTVSDHNGDFGKYTGTLIRGKPNGTGTMTYGDGRTYTGEWMIGRWHGHGKCIFTNGDTYTGDYLKDQRHGIGRYEWNDGRVYDGSFVFDHRDGKGVYSWPDGSVYIGDFKKGLRHGHGLYTFAEGSVYTGSWENGKYHGNGECRWKDGRCYQGEWNEGTAHGYGVERKADGTVRHKGLWKKNKPVKQTPEIAKAQNPNSQHVETSEKKVKNGKVKVLNKSKTRQTKQLLQQSEIQKKSSPHAVTNDRRDDRPIETEEMATLDLVSSAEPIQMAKVNDILSVERRHTSRQSPADIGGQTKGANSNANQYGTTLNRTTAPPKTSDMYADDKVSSTYLPTKPDMSLSTNSRARNSKETTIYDVKNKHESIEINTTRPVTLDSSQHKCNFGKEIVEGRSVVTSPSEYVIFLHGTRVDSATEQLWREFCASRQQQFDAIDNRERSTIFTTGHTTDTTKVQPSQIYKHGPRSSSWEDDAGEVGIPSPNKKTQYTKQDYIPDQSTSQTTYHDSTIHAIENTNTQSKLIPVVAGEDLSIYYNNPNSEFRCRDNQIGLVLDTNPVSNEEVENVVHKGRTVPLEKKYNNDRMAQQLRRLNTSPRNWRGGHGQRLHDELIVIRD